MEGVAHRDNRHALIRLDERQNVFPVFAQHDTGVGQRDADWRVVASVEQLNRLFSFLGLTPDTHIVVYDDEGGGWAGRFLWTLDVIGHQRGTVSMLGRLDQLIANPGPLPQIRHSSAVVRPSRPQAGTDMPFSGCSSESCCCGCFFKSPGWSRHFTSTR